MGRPWALPGWRTALIRRMMPARRVLAALLFGALAAGATACTSIDVVPLRDLQGDVVPLAYRVDVEVRSQSGQPLESAVVYLRNDEDTVAELAWTDELGQASLTQAYLSGTVAETNRLLFPDEVHLRFPRFQLRAARAGYLPAQRTFTDAPFLPELFKNAATAYVQSQARLALTLEAVPRRTPAWRHAGALFAAPPGAEVRVGVRQPAYVSQFLRLTAEERPRLEACVRAYVGTKGEEVVVVARPTLATQRYFLESLRLAETCDRVVTTGPYVYPVAPNVDPKANAALAAALGLGGEWRRPPRTWRRADLLRADLERLARRHPLRKAAFLPKVLARWFPLRRKPEGRALLPELLLAFAADAGRAPPEVATPRAKRVADVALALAHKRLRIAVVCRTDVAPALDRVLVSRGLRRLSEVWLEAWPAG